MPELFDHDYLRLSTSWNKEILHLSVSNTCENQVLYQRRSCNILTAKSPHVSPANLEGQAK
jgi:hypothetical protein